MRKLVQAWSLGGLSVGELLRRTWRESMEDDVLGHAAQAAFFSMLALVPALVLAITLPTALSDRYSLDRFLESLSDALPQAVFQIIHGQVEDIRARPAGGIISVTALVTLWGASGVFGSLASCLNAIYDVEETRPWWKTQLLALGMTLAEAVLIVVGAGLVLAGGELAAWAVDGLGLAASAKPLVTVLQWVLVLTLVSLALALLYYTGPDVRQDWAWITPGCVVATALWIALSLAFRLYAANFTDYNATYGTLGGVIVLLLWLYLSAAAILVGGEINAVIEHAAPSGKAPGEKVERPSAAAAEAAADAADESEGSGPVNAHLTPAG
jgi:membrane protein